MSNSPVPCLSHYLYRSAFTVAFLNKQCIALDYYHILYSFIYIYMFIHDIQQPYTLVWPIRQGLKHTHNTV